MIRIIATALIGAVALLAPVGARSATNSPSVVIRVNSTPVTRTDVWLEMERILPMASYHGSLDKEAWQRVVDQALDAATDRELIYQAAVKKGFKVADKRLEEIETVMIGRTGSKKAFEDWLRGRGLSHKEFLEIQRRYEVAAALERQVLGEIQGKAPPSDAELRAYYDANRSKFMVPPSTDVQHLLVQVQPWASTEDWKHGESRARWITKRARSGEDFGRLVTQYSDDKESKESDGRMSSIHEGRFAQPIEEMVAGLEPGQIGGPVRSLYGYHVVKLLARHPARQLDYAQVDREQLRADLRRKTIQDAIDDWHRGLRKDAQVVFDQAQVELLRSPPASAAKGPKAPARGTE